MEFPEGRFMECPIHGKQRPAFVCQHLATARGTQKRLGFFQPTQIDVAQWDAYTGWCAECDRVLHEHSGEWNERSEAFSRPQIICLGCFRQLYQRNALSASDGLPP